MRGDAVCLVFLLSGALMCFDVSPIDCLEPPADDWHFDSGCDWLTGPARRTDGRADGRTDGRTRLFIFPPFFNLLGCVFFSPSAYNIIFKRGWRHRDLPRFRPAVPSSGSPALESSSCIISAPRHHFLCSTQKFQTRPTQLIHFTALMHISIFYAFFGIFFKKKTLCVLPYIFLYSLILNTFCLLYLNLFSVGPPQASQEGP